MLDDQDYETKNYISFVPSPEFVSYMYSTENAILPYFETAICIADIFPVLFMCNVLSASSYAQYDEVSTELECINNGFKGFRFIWFDDG